MRNKIEVTRYAKRSYRPTWRKTWIRYLEIHTIKNYCTLDERLTSGLWLCRITNFWETTICSRRLSVTYTMFLNKSTSVIHHRDDTSHRNLTHRIEINNLRLLPLPLSLFFSASSISRVALCDSFWGYSSGQPYTYLCKKAHRRG